MWKDFKKQGDLTWIFKYQWYLYEDRGKNNPGPVPRVKVWVENVCAGCICE